MGIEEGIGNEIGGRINENATMGVRRYEAVQDKKLIYRGDSAYGGNQKERSRKEVDVVGACDEKRGALGETGAG